MSDPFAESDSTHPKKTGFFAMLGPGLITGASDDDPSGIATYSQAGAQFGYDLGWTLLLTWPLMCAIQEISARIGRVTGRGLAGNLKEHFPRWILYLLIVSLLVANVINLGADLGAMGAALMLLIPGDKLLYAAGFGVVSLLLEVFVHYDRYASVLKWMTVSLFAYFGVAAMSHVPWGTLNVGYLTVVVAVLGTTISPYLFFWQASEEVEDLRERPGAKPLNRDPGAAKAEFGRIKWDTYIGMAFSNLVALAIMISAAATLHAHGVTDIQTSSDAAKALEPIAGHFAFLIFALGIIGTGLLAVPVLAGSAAYAVGETFGFHVGLGRKLRRAKLFYAVIAGAIVVGVGLNFTPIDPVKALFWSAVVNGVVAVPVMVMTMLLGARKAAMGQFTLPPYLVIVGWIATAVMGLAAVGMFATMAMPSKS
jgi:Mn2+/Fe2+ NRAMP family transporter